MECRLRRQAVVFGIDPFDGERNLEVSFENEIFEIERFAVFLDGFRPLGFSEVDAFCRNLDGGRLQEFVSGDVGVHMPVVRDDNFNGNV